jgi:hypothetical protein
VDTTTRIAAGCFTRIVTLQVGAFAAVGNGVGPDLPGRRRRALEGPVGPARGRGAGAACRRRRRTRGVLRRRARGGCRAGRGPTGKPWLSMPLDPWTGPAPSDAGRGHRRSSPRHRPQRRGRRGSVAAIAVVCHPAARPNLDPRAVDRAATRSRGPSVVPSTVRPTARTYRGLAASRGRASRLGRAPAVDHRWRGLANRIFHAACADRHGRPWTQALVDHRREVDR